MRSTSLNHMKGRGSGAMLVASRLRTSMFGVTYHQRQRRQGAKETWFRIFPCLLRRIDLSCGGRATFLSYEHVVDANVFDWVLRDAGDDCRHVI